MNILSRKIKSKYWALFVTVATAASLAIPRAVYAKDDTVKKIIDDLLSNIIYGLFIWPLSQVLKLELLILPIVAEYNNFTSQGGVVEGWRAMRDLSNMFFILVLLVIALATILKIQSYGYRQLLKKLLIVAVLINFSKTIVGIVIDFSQVIMLTFVDVIKDIAAGNVMNALGLHKIMQQGSDISGESVQSSTVVAYFLGAIMMLITVMVMVAFLGMLAMRIVTLWVLIVLSPLAFLAFTFPKTEKYFNEWSEELLKNLIAGPSLAFFLWLAFSITGGGNVNESFNEVGDANAAGDPNSPEFDASKAADPSNVLNFVVGIAILVAGLQMTAKSGAAGAGMAGNMASKIKSTPGKIGRKAGGLAVAGAAAGGKLLYQGRSGEGMIKGRLSRLRGMTGRGMAEAGQQMAERGGIAGRFSGLVTRAGMRRVAADQGSRKRRAEYEATRAAGVADQGAYWSTKRGDEAQYHAAKAALARGETNVNMGQQGNLNAARMSELFENYGDTDAGTSLQKRSAAVNTQESIQRNITDSGLATTLKNMSFAGMDPQNADHQAVLATILDQDGETRAKAMDGMEREERNSLVAALENFQPNDGQAIAAVDANGNAALNEESQAYRQHAAMVQFGNAAAAEAAFARVGQPEAQAAHDQVLAQGGTQENADAARARTLEAVRGAFAQTAVRDISGKQMARVGANSEMFQAMSGLMNAGQRTEFLQKTDDQERRQGMVAAQVEAGNVQVMMDGVATRDFVEDNNIQAYFNQQISMPNLDREQRAGRMSQLARQNMSHAHLAFMSMDGDGNIQADNDGNPVLDQVAFNEFARGLKLEELLKLPKAQLDTLADDMDTLNQGMRDALAEKGYGNQLGGGAGGGDAAGAPIPPGPGDPDAPGRQ